MATTRTDIIVLGSSLGGLVAAAYLARSGLRVVLLEEERLTKRPPLLREPFVLTGLHAGGPIQRVLRELALPLIDQRRIVRNPIALQVILPGARIDVRAGRAELARELDSFGLIGALQAEAWLERVDSAGELARQRLWQITRPPPVPAAVRRLPMRHLFERRPRELPLAAPLPEMPEALRRFADAQLSVLSAQAEAAQLEAPSLLLHSLRKGGFELPGGEELFLDLLRRRLEGLYGEIRAVGEFSLVSERGEVGVELARGRLMARGMVIAAPRELVARAGSSAERVPRWLRGGPPPRPLPTRLFRAERDSLPIGLARRAVLAVGEPDELLWLSRHPDPTDDKFEWLSMAGPGAARLAPANPLGELNPFPGDGIVMVDPGPEPVWDRDANGLRFIEPRLPIMLRNRPPVVAAGPEIEPGLGFEGEVLRAREAALHLVDRLGIRRALT